MTDQHFTTERKGAIVLHVCWSDTTDDPETGFRIIYDRKSKLYPFRLEYWSQIRCDWFWFDDYMFITDAVDKMREKLAKYQTTVA